MKTAKKAWLSLILLVGTLIINGLGALGYINGLSQKEISDMYQTLITPSPFTFSIWSVIYALLIASVIAMIVKKEEPYYQKAVENISELFWISFVLNMIWIISFSYVLIEISAVLIFAFLITLLLICKKLLKIQESRRWLLPLTFGLYAGWLTIATLVNISAILVKLKWNGFGIASEIWTSIILLIAVILVITILVDNKNATFPLPVAWAYFGIYQQLKISEIFNREYRIVFAILLIGLATLACSGLIQFYKNNYSILPIKKE